MKRWLVRICVFLLLGAIVNVAVAWGSKLWAKEQPGPFLTELSTDAAASLWKANALPSWSAAPAYVGFVDESSSVIAVGVVSGVATADVEYLETCVTWTSYGLPYHSLRMMAWSEDFAIVRERDARLFGWAFPIDPIWPGFAINTVFYAGVLWLLFAGPFVLRRRRRIRRGLCPKCAYDLRGAATQASVCPECGATR